MDSNALTGPRSIHALMHVSIGNLQRDSRPGDRANGRPGRLLS